MPEKVEGATNKCGSCGELTVCRKITYEGKEKLQWQNHDDTNAHYGFDFQTKKSWCKKTPATTDGSQPFNMSTNTGDNTPPVSKDPTPEQFLRAGIAMIPDTIQNPESHVTQIQEETKARISHDLIVRSVIEKAMNDLGLQHPSRIAFIKDVLR